MASRRLGLERARLSETAGSPFRLSPGTPALLTPRNRMQGLANGFCANQGQASACRYSMFPFLNLGMCRSLTWLELRQLHALRCQWTCLSPEIPPVAHRRTLRRSDSFRTRRRRELKKDADQLSAVVRVSRRKPHRPDWCRLGTGAAGRTRAGAATGRRSSRGQVGSGIAVDICGFNCSQRAKKVG